VTGKRFMLSASGHWNPIPHPPSNSLLQQSLDTILDSLERCHALLMLN
jgi:hypothetical protein